MRKLRIGVLDLVTKSPNPSLYGRVMNANLASIMPQIIGVWCSQMGHDVSFCVYTGLEDLLVELPKDLDLIFIGTFTQSAQLSYALSNMFRQRGAVTVIGGPHARCYPEDAAKYFDYVLGFTDKKVVLEVLSECAGLAPDGPADLGADPAARAAQCGRALALHRVNAQEGAHHQVRPDDREPRLSLHLQLLHRRDGRLPTAQLPAAAGRSEVSPDQAQEADPRLARSQLRGPLRGLHGGGRGRRPAQADPAHRREQPLAPGRAAFEAAQQNNFKAILPGIESWYDLGNKSKTRKTGMEKVQQVSEHVNLILRYIPYIQTNFVLGLDGDQGSEPFELTKKFIDLSPGAFPAYSLLSAFGRAAPMNLDYQRAGRVLPFPFHFLNNNHAMNVRPKNYSWTEFYDGLVAVTGHSFSWKAIMRRIPATAEPIPKWLNVMRAISSEGFGRLKYHTMMRKLLDTDRSVRAFFEGDTTELPEFYRARIERELGPLYQHLHEGALMHDQNAYLNSQTPDSVVIKMAPGA
jgi:hypothetical protein